MGKILQEINEKDFYPRKHVIDQVCMSNEYYS